MYKSLATNVFANLALEDWIFQNVDLKSRRILLLWRNLPCVVIGRHQNPWMEANMPLIRRRGITLARRRSGGGAVYHDLGNLNVTVFTGRHDYHRPRNLGVVVDALNKGWGIGLHSNCRDDIVYNDHWKLSGSAARLVKSSAYHHFTLLLRTDEENLRCSLKPHPQLHLSQTTATGSKRSKIVNLCTLNPQITYNAVVDAIAQEFYAVHQVTEDRKIVEVDPLLEKDFPGIIHLQQQLQEWEWVYGKTPAFSIAANEEFDFGKLEFSGKLVKGVLQEVSLVVSSSLDDAATPNTPSTTMPTPNTLSSRLDELSSELNGRRFQSADIATCLEAMGNADHNIRDIIQWISQLS